MNMTNRTMAERDPMDGRLRMIAWMESFRFSLRPMKRRGRSSLIVRKILMTSSLLEAIKERRDGTTMKKSTTLVV